jgi:PASTA domain-containing protein
VTTNWVVTTASERVALDETTRGGEATFMVTNQSPRSARAMFDIKTGDGVDESWFSVEDPQRPIRPAASVPYLVRIQVPQQVPPGQYEFEARVYPPDSAPEENFVLSRRVMLEVPKPPAPPKKKFPWWIVVAAALLVLVIGVVTWIVWPSGGDPDAMPSASPTPTTSAASVEYAITPQVIKYPIDDARANLAKAGLTVGVMRYRAGSTFYVTGQSIPPGNQAPKGTKVDLDLQMPFSVPVITAPGPNTNIEAGRWPTVMWTQAEPYVTKWQVNIFADQCTRQTAGGPQDCRQQVPVGAPFIVTSREFSGPAPKLTFAPPATGAGTWQTGGVMISVLPVDDFGIVIGPGTGVRFFLVH